MEGIVLSPPSSIKKSQITQVCPHPPWLDNVSLALHSQSHDFTFQEFFNICCALNYRTFKLPLVCSEHRSKQSDAALLGKRCYFEFQERARTTSRLMAGGISANKELRRICGGARPNNSKTQCELFYTAGLRKRDNVSVTLIVCI